MYSIANKYNDLAKNLPKAGTLIGLQADIREKVSAVLKRQPPHMILNSRKFSQSEATRLASHIASLEPYISALFNNAGVHHSPGSVNDYKAPAANAAAYVETYFNSVSQETFNNVLNTNSVGPYWMSFAFLPLLEKFRNTEGRRIEPMIVMTSSMNGW